MKKVLMAFLLMSFAGASAYAAVISIPSMAGEGTARYTSFGFPGETPEGILVIRGMAARTIFDSMTNVTPLPAVWNLAQLAPKNVSLNMLERKYGESVSCFNRPESVGDKWKLGADGQIIFEMTCTISFSNAQMGIIKQGLNSKVAEMKLVP